jgi:hypothetical protein
MEPKGDLPRSHGEHREIENSICHCKVVICHWAISEMAKFEMTNDQ